MHLCVCHLIFTEKQLGINRKKYFLWNLLENIPCIQIFNNYYNWLCWHSYNFHDAIANIGLIMLNIFYWCYFVDLIKCLFFIAHTLIRNIAHLW